MEEKVNGVGGSKNAFFQVTYFLNDPLSNIQRLSEKQFWKSLILSNLLGEANATIHLYLFPKVGVCKHFLKALQWKHFFKVTFQGFYLDLLFFSKIYRTPIFESTWQLLLLLQLSMLFLKGTPSPRFLKNFQRFFVTIELSLGIHIIKLLF